MKELFNDGWSFKKILPDGANRTGSLLTFRTIGRYMTYLIFMKAPKAGIVRNLFMTIRKTSVFS